MRRVKLKEVLPDGTTHAGLWLDKFFDEQLDELAKGQSKKGPKERKQQQQPKQVLVKQIAAEIRMSGLYPDFYKRWKALLTSDEQTQTAEAEVKGRLAIGLGDESVLETSITLHHTYGVPYIRGSALKGLAAAFARNRLGEMWKAKGFRGGKWQEISPAYKVVFGETDDAGYVTFHDALYVPGSGVKGQALHADIMTVHHPRYYSEKKENGELPPPADWDEPNPVPFLSATGRYLIALSAPKGCEEWRQAAFDILKLALAEEGIGAKTSSGYGRMKLTSRR
jgi:CRISPR-associated protein Cmr6